MNSKVLLWKVFIGVGIGMVLWGPSLLAQNSPHAVWGKVLNSAKQPPKSESFQFYTYIKKAARPRC